jgi:hypothetical protein
VKQILTRRYVASNLPTTGTRYYDIIGGTNTHQTLEASCQVVAAAAGDFRNFTARVTTAPGSGVTHTFTLRINGADTAATFTIAGTATTGSYTSGDVAVAEGDLVSFSVTVSGGTAASSSSWWASLEFEGDTANQSLYGSHTGGGLGTMTRYAHPWMSTLNIDATRTNVEGIAAAAGDITKIFARCTGNNVAGAEAVTALVVLNGVDQDGTGGTVDTRVTLNSGTQAANTSFTLPVVAGDLLAIKTSWTSGNTGHRFSFSLQFTATTDGQSQFSSRPTSAVDTSAVRYALVPADSRNWNLQTTEAAAAVYGGVTSFDLVGLAVYCYTQPGVGKSHAFTSFVTGAASGPTVTISGTDQFEFATGTVTVTSADTTTLRATPSSTPAGSQITFTFIQSTDVADPPPDPGGEVPPGTNPPQGTQPGANPPQGTQATSFPLLFLEIKNGATTTAYAETMLPDRSTWWHGQKTPRILTVSPIRRALSRDGGFETSAWTVTLNDTDRSFRAAAATTTLTGQYVALYVVDDATRRAEGVPYRIAAGMIASHRALPDMRYELQVEDVLGTRFSDVFREPKIPSFVLTSTDFPVMDPTRDGGSVQVALGELSDEGGATPQGVVPAIYLGFSNLRTLSNNSAAVNTIVDGYMLCQNACRSVLNLYYNPPTSPSLRFVVPSTAYGSLVWAPYMPSWSQTGYSGNYADWPNSSVGYRFTPVFIPYATEIASMARQGQILITGNLSGTESHGDGTGALITAPERLIQHVLTNYVFTDYRVGSYAPVPFFPANSYTILDTSTVENAVLASASRVPPNGYVAGALLGADGQARAGFDVLGDLLRGSDLDMGVNRHGQIILSREAISATAVVSFTAQHDILDGSFEAWTATDEYVNRLESQHAYRYVAPTAPLPTPSFGAPLPRNPVASYNPFSSGVVRLESTGAQSLVGRVVKSTLDNYVMRANTYALNVASTVFIRQLGPSADGPHMVRFSTGWQGFGKNQVDVDLGSVITVDHPEGLSSTGYTAKRVRVLAVDVDPQNARVTLEGRVLP